MSAPAPELTRRLLLAVFIGTALGSFCLGALLETLTRRQPHTPAARLRLVQRGLGTGLLGGRLATVPEAAVSFGWALTGVLVTIVGGVAAAACGIGLAARLSRRHR